MILTIYTKYLKKHPVCFGIMKNSKKREKFDFSLESFENKRLHLIVYLSTVLLVFAVYLIFVLFFDDSPMLLIIGFTSFLIGIGMIFYRNKIVNIINDKMLDNKIKKRKKANKANLQETIRKITPSHRNLKLKIGGGVTIRDRMTSIYSKFTKKKSNEKSDEYIEYKD